MTHITAAKDDRSTQPSIVGKVLKAGEMKPKCQGSKSKKV